MNSGLHGAFIKPLPVEKLLQYIHGFQADVYDFSAGAQSSIAQATNQIFSTMSHAGNPLQPNLRRRTFHGVHGAKQAIDFVRAGIGFQRKQAIGDHLKMLFCFGHKEFKDLSGNIAIVRQEQA